MPTPTPISALSMVMPAATSDPKVTTSTTIATATPIASVLPTSGSEFITSPPCSTCRPAAWAAEPLCSYAVRWESVTLSTCSVNWTEIRAYRPSGETEPVVNGSSAASTPGSSLASLTSCPSWA